MSFKSMLKSGGFAVTVAAILGLSSLTVTGSALSAAAAPAKSAGATEEKKPVQILFTNVNIFDGKTDGLAAGMNVLVEGNLIKSVAKGASDAPGASTGYS